MHSKSYRLNRFINRHTRFSLADTRLLVATKRILVDGQAATSIQQTIGQFTRVELDGICLQDKSPVYLKLHKPKGVVSATKDNKHTTVIDLIDHPQKSELHIVGRLDFNTTGLVLLTNDGAWSRRLSLPETKLPKVYEVSLAKPLNEGYIKTFAEGIYFVYEGITTQPAQLTILSDFSARLSLTEGKYHQVKRMFGYFDNEVLALHRVAVGNILLGDLPEAESCLLTDSEINPLDG